MDQVKTSQHFLSETRNEENCKRSTQHRGEECRRLRQRKFIVYAYSKNVEEAVQQFEYSKR